MSESQNDRGSFDGKIADYADRLRIIWRLWTVPKSAIEAISIEPENRKNDAAGLALAIMAFLLFVLLGSSGVQTWGFDFAVGIGLAAMVNYLSNWVKWKLNQNVWISGYWTVVIVMICTIFVEAFLSPYYINLDLGFPAVVIVPILLAIIPTWVLWLVKARFIDKNKMSIDGIAYAAVISCLGGIATVILSLLSDRLINNLI